VSDKPVPKAGWYPDPAGSARRRWWDGAAWGDLEVVKREAGWYPDPEGSDARRWWDGEDWGQLEGPSTPAGWYQDSVTGKYRYWDGSGYDDSKIRGTAKTRKIVSGGGTLAKYGVSVPARVRLWIIIGIVVVVVLGGALLLKGGGGTTSTTTTTSTIPEVLNPSQGTMYGSTQGLLVADHLPGGVTKFVCINGTSHVVGPDRAIESPCASG
jgi:hypothetical protein